MAFAPVTLLTISVLVLLALGGGMLRSSRGEPACPLLRWSGAGILCLGAGFALILAAPADIHAPLRVVGLAALMLSYGLLWGAVRRFDRRPAPFEIVGAGALAWLLAATLFEPSQAWRIAVTSGIVAAYSFAIVREHHGSTRGEPLPARRWAAWVFAGHGGFVALRMLLGPTFGFAPWGPEVAQVSGALLGLETVLMAVLAGAASVAMSRERAAGQHRHDALEDALTGVGNRRALFRSGGPLIAEARSRGLPAALLLMDLDGFGGVNDRHGREAGDRLLVAFARLAHDYLPPTSLVCRIGGGDFAAVLPGADAARARAVADEIRALFAHLVLDGPQGPLRTTVSIGVAVAAEDDLAAFLARADQCLDAAKAGGRDRVTVEGDAASADRADVPAARRSAA